MKAKGILDDLYEALQWEASANAPMQKLDYGGSAPMDFELTVLDTPAEQLERVAEEKNPLPSQRPPCLLRPYCQPYHASREEVFSYSSIGEAAHQTPEPEEEAESSLFDVDRGFFGKRHCAGYGISSFGAARYCAIDGSALKRPANEAVVAQVRAQGLTPSQEVRLSAALDRWFAKRCRSRFGG